MYVNSQDNYKVKNLTSIEFREISVKSLNVLSSP